MPKTLVLPLLFAGLLAAPLQAARDEPITGLVLKVNGEAWVEGGEGKFVDLKPGHLVVEGDHLSTGKGTLFLSLADKSTVSVGHWTDLVIREQKVEKKKRRIVFRLFSGIFKAIVKKLEKDSYFKVETDLAVAGVKGTQFSVEAEEGEMANVLVTKGVVNMAGADGKNETDVGKKQGALVTDKDFTPAKKLPGAAWTELKDDWKSGIIVHGKRQGLRRKLNRRRKSELKALDTRLKAKAAFAALLAADEVLKAAHLKSRLARKLMRKKMRKAEKEKKKKKRKTRFWFEYQKFVR